MDQQKLQQLLKESTRTHNHLCPRQVLGVRMGLYAAQLLSLDLPQADKRLHAFVETDGCFLDGVAVSTGCYPGRRTLHVLDFGKVAATFVDSVTNTTLRLRPQPEVRDLWQEYAPNAVDRWHGYLEAYQVMPAERLLLAEPVRLTVSLTALISRDDARAVCTRCGEEIFNEREVYLGDQPLCRACAGEQYYQHPDMPTPQTIEKQLPASRRQKLD